MVGFLDAFISFAASIGVLIVLASPLIVYLNKRGGIYKGREAVKKRDDINKQYRTNLGSALLAIVCFVAYIGLCKLILSEYGFSLLIYILCGFLFLPSMLICSVIILIYNYSVHGYANMKNK